MQVHILNPGNISVAKDFLKAPNLDSLSTLELQAMFPVFDETQLKESRARFSLLPSLQIQNAFIELRKTNLLELISGAQLIGLDLSILNISDWECIFPIGGQLPRPKGRSL